MNNLDESNLKITFSTQPPPAMLAPQPGPDFEVQAVLYFLDGHYLFRHFDGKKSAAKFVTAVDLAAAFSQTEQDSGWLAPGIVRAGSCARGPWYVYSAPAQKVTLSLVQEDPITIPIPRTVMLGLGGEYYLWALREKYFAPGASAYQAPFPNVHPDGKVCWGENRPPAAEARVARKVWDLFFDSLFNGDLKEHKSGAHPEDIRLTLRELAEKKAKAYPLHDLVISGRNIGPIIERIIGG